MNNILDIIKESNDILLLSHESPDGDAIGSLMGFYHMLKNMNNQGTPQTGQGMSVIFRVSTNQANVQTGPSITIQCTLDEKVGTVIERYRNKTGDRDTTRKFIYNAKSLNPALTLAEAGINNQATIFVMVTKDIKGAFL